MIAQVREVLRKLSVPVGTRSHYLRYAAREVVKSIPPTLIENLQKASDLAERQYRVGALGVNLLLETHREYLEALKTREEASIQAWRNILDLELLNLAPTGAGKITVTPRPTNEPTQKP